MIDFGSSIPISARIYISPFPSRLRKPGQRTGDIAYMTIRRYKNHSGVITGCAIADMMPGSNPESEWSDPAR